jgi:hypothetical protein
MLVTSYLSGSAGSPAPTSQLRGDALPYFTTYAGQFERLWKRAQELTDADFARIHKDKMPGAPAPDASVKG